MVYIKINGDNSVVLGGTVISDGMASDGYVGYDKEIPSSRFLKWDEPSLSIIEDDVKLLEYLDGLKTRVKSNVKHEFDKEVNLISDALPHEIGSWQKQEDEAKSHLADLLAPTPYLDALVASRAMGETVTELSNKIIANAEAYATAYFPLLGKYHNLINAIDAAVTEQDVLNISWNNINIGVV